MSSPPWTLKVQSLGLSEKCPSASDLHILVVGAIDFHAERQGFSPKASHILCPSPLLKVMKLPVSCKKLVSTVCDTQIPGR